MASPGKEVYNRGGVQRTRRKRVVTTAEERERNRLKAEDERWRAAKTPEAKAWVNPTRLIREAFAGVPGDEDILVLKVGPGLRRDLTVKAESFNLHVETFDAQSKVEGPPDSWIVIGRHRMSVAGKVREIQRQSQRAYQQAMDQEDENGEEGEAEADEGAEEQSSPEHRIDPRFREYSVTSHPLQPASVQPASVQPMNDAKEQRIPEVESNAGLPGPYGDDQEQLDPRLNESTYEDLKITPNDEPPRNLSTQDMNDQPEKNPGPELHQAPLAPMAPMAPMAQMQPPTPQEPHQDTKPYMQPPPSSDDLPNERTANWVTQQSQNTAAPPSSKRLNPIGRWKVSSQGIEDAYGTTIETFTLNIFVTKTLPKTDNDTDDGKPTSDLDGYKHNLIDDQDTDQDLTEDQKSRQGTYQMWATFNFGLFNGIIRFMAPNIPSGKQYRRSDFDLLETQLPSSSNRTFQYKWRGRDSSDNTIHVEADQVTQWIRFEEDGITLAGVFQDEFLGENAFEAVKVAANEANRVHLGRMWSEVSPKAHEYETQRRR